MVISSDLAVGFFGNYQPKIARWQYTLTTLLGEWLHQAETRYGPRDKEWTILGIEFHSDIVGEISRPYVWPLNDRKQIAVVLTVAASKNANLAETQKASRQ